MTDPAGGIEGGHRFGAGPLAAAGMHQAHGQAGRGGLQDRAHHLPALVGLGDQRVGAVILKRRSGASRPVGRQRRAEGQVGQHHGAASRAVTISARHHNPAFIRARPATGRRVEGHHDAVQPGHGTPRLQPRRLDLGPRPKGTLGIIDQQALDLLPPQRRAAIGSVERLNKARRQIGRIGGGRLVRHPDRPLGIPALHEGFQGRDRARRGGQQDLRCAAQPDPHAQRVENTLRVRPGGELITPGIVKLRPAQPVRILGGKGIGQAAGGENQAFAADFIARPLVPRAQSQQAGRAFDHHFAHIIESRPHQRDPAHRPQRPVADPFGPGAGLAGAAPAQEQPGSPLTRRRQLRARRAVAEVRMDRVAGRLLQILVLPLPRLLQRCQRPECIDEGKHRCERAGLLHLRPPPGCRDLVWDRQFALRLRPACRA